MFLLRTETDRLVWEIGYLLSKFGYPETNGAAISAQLDEIALDAHHSFIRTNSTNDLTLLMSLNDAFFEQCGFREHLITNRIIPISTV